MQFQPELMGGWQLHYKLPFHASIPKLFQAWFASVLMEELYVYTQAAVKPGEHVCS